MDQFRSMPSDRFGRTCKQISMNNVYIPHEDMAIKVMSVDPDKLDLTLERILIK